MPLVVVVVAVMTSLHLILLNYIRLKFMVFVNHKIWIVVSLIITVAMGLFPCEISLIKKRQSTLPSGDLNVLRLFVLDPSREVVVRFCVGDEVFVIVVIDCVDDDDCGGGDNGGNDADDWWRDLFDDPRPDEPTVPPTDDSSAIELARVWTSPVETRRDWPRFGGGGFFFASPVFSEFLLELELSEFVDGDGDIEREFRI